jgi:hypothetical protein
VKVYRNQLTLLFFSPRLKSNLIYSQLRRKNIQKKLKIRVADASRQENNPKKNLPLRGNKITPKFFLPLRGKKIAAKNLILFFFFKKESKSYA